MGHNFVRDIVWRKNERKRKEKSRLESYDRESDKCVKCEQTINRKQKEIERKKQLGIIALENFDYEKAILECENATFNSPRPLCLIHWTKWRTMGMKPKTNKAFKQVFVGTLINAIAQSKKKKEKRAVWGAAYDKYIKPNTKLVECVKRQQKML